MLLVGRLVGWALLLAGLVVLARDVIGFLDTGTFSPVVLGELWFTLHSSSLNLMQAVIQRYVHPVLWDPVITSILFLWAFAILLVPGLALLLLCHRRNGAGRRHRH
jgi:hypothetical protein